MQANRITVFRRAPWRIALDALRRAWRSAAQTRQHDAYADDRAEILPASTHAATSAVTEHDIATAVPAHTASFASAHDDAHEPHHTLLTHTPPPAIDRRGLALGLQTALGAVDFLAQIDDALRFMYVSDASIEFIAYHRDYLSMLTLHDLVPSEKADELHAPARAASSNRRRSTS